MAQSYNMPPDLRASMDSTIEQPYHKPPTRSVPPPSSRFHFVDAITATKPDRNSLPRLLRNLKYFFLDHWFDCLCILAIAGVSGAVWILDLERPRLFPIATIAGDAYDPSVAYPYRPSIINSLNAGLLCALIPIGVILLCQLFVRSFYDFSAAILGLLESLVTGTCFQVILKQTIGGLRPHFLAVCEPVIPDGLVGEGFNGIMYTVDQVCTGDPGKINNALQSFPSGHSEIAFAGFGYLALYLFTHLDIPSRSAPRAGFWRMLAVIVPLWVATYIACTLVLTYNHHAHDCIAGAMIGSLCAVTAYRINFRSVFDGRTNKLPRLTRRAKRALEREHEMDTESGAMMGHDDDEMRRSGRRRRDRDSDNGHESV